MQPGLGLYIMESSEHNDAFYVPNSKGSVV